MRGSPIGNPGFIDRQNAEGAAVHIVSRNPFTPAIPGAGKDP